MFIDHRDFAQKNFFQSHCFCNSNINLCLLNSRQGTEKVSNQSYNFNPPVVLANPGVAMVETSNQLNHPV